MAGYSSSPLWKKLGVKPGNRVQLVDAPAAWSIPDLPAEVVPVESDDTGEADIIVAFFRHASEYAASIGDLGRRIFPAGSVWVAWPRKAAGHVSDLGDVIVRDTALRLGLVDVKVAALDDDWSGLKLVWRVELRG